MAAGCAGPRLRWPPAAVATDFLQVIDAVRVHFLAMKTCARAALIKGTWRGGKSRSGPRR